MYILLRNRCTLCSEIIVHFAPKYSTMENEVLTAVLTELLEETKEFKREQMLYTKAIEVFGENMSVFEKKMQALEIKVAPVEIRPIVEKLSEHHVKIERIVAAQPKEVLHENRFLFYSEDFWRTHGKRVVNNFITGFFLIVAFVIALLFLEYYIEKDSENMRYKDAWQYLYVNQDDKNQRYLNTIIFEFNNDSIRDIRNEFTIKKFIEYREKEN